MNSGGSWTFANLYPFLNTVVIDPVTPDTVYSPYGAGVLKTVNGGVNWVYQTPIPNTNVDSRSLTVDPNSHNTLYLAAVPGIYKSTDGGSSWFPIQTGLPADSSGNVNGYDIAADPHNSGVVYLATDFGAFKSVNGGASWFAINNGMPTDSGTGAVLRVSVIKVAPSNSSIVYARSDLYSGRIMRSGDGGATWTQTNSSGVQDNAQGFAIDPITPSTLYHAASNNLWKSTDSGLNWTGTLFKAQCRAVVIDPHNTSTLYTGSWIDWDGFVTKLNASGTALVYSTLLGGEFDEFIEHVAVDGSGNAIVAGSSQSFDFPTVNAGQPFQNGYQNAIVAKFSPSGAPVYSTYLGGNNYEVGNACAADAAGNAYITGQTYSDDFYAVKALQPAYQGSSDVFVTKLSANGQSILYSSYMGTAGYDWPRGIATDGTNIFVAGHTDSASFPLSYIPQQVTLNGPDDVFVANVVPDNSPPVLTDDVYTVKANTTLVVPAPGLFANDTDPDGDPIVGRYYYIPSSGSLTVYTNGALTFTPAKNFIGKVASGYFASAGSNAMSYANITFNVVNPTITLSNIVVKSITDTSAIVTWTTDAASDSLVNYGTTTAYDHAASNAVLTTSHSVALTGLTPGTLYHFQVTSKETAFGNTASSADQTFTTQTVENPALSISVTGVTAGAGRTSAIVTYTVTNNGGEADGFTIANFTASDLAVTSASGGSVPSVIPAAGGGVPGTAVFTVTWNRSAPFPMPAVFFGSFTARYTNTAGGSRSQPVTLRIRVN